MSQIEDRRREIAEKVKEARRGAGLSQIRLAEMLEDHGLQMTGSTIAKIENGSRALEIVEAQVISSVLQLGWGELNPFEKLSNEKQIENLKKIANRNVLMVFEFLGDIEEKLGDIQECLFLLSKYGEKPSREDDLSQLEGQFQQLESQRVELWKLVAELSSDYEIIDNSPDRDFYLGQ